MPRPIAGPNTSLLARPQHRWPGRPLTKY